MTRPLYFALLFFLTIALCPQLGVAQDDDFAPRQVVRAFDAITAPDIVPAAEAKGWVRDDELVLGVVIAGEARAYPINMLTSPSREIINDNLGGRAIAATW